jgi:hypothetical protein
LDHHSGRQEPIAAKVKKSLITPLPAGRQGLSNDYTARHSRNQIRSTKSLPTGRQAKFETNSNDQNSNDLKKLEEEPNKIFTKFQEMER